MAKNVKYDNLLTWDHYVGKSPAEALKEINSHATNVSDKVRTWYWESAKNKKYFSLGVRCLIFILLVCGAVLPILAGLLNETDTRLKFTQFGVAALAVAGLLQIADQVFGWSSGWIRYISTVTAMEDLNRKFELDWADYMIGLSGSISDNDKKPLFDLAKKFEDELAKKQSEETDKWVIEFNSSTALLSELIKSQRETAEKSYIEEKERLKTKEPGAIELTITYKADPIALKIVIDSEPEENFTGTIWSKLGLVPGIHEIRVSTTTKSPITFKMPVNVPAGGIAKQEINIP